MLQHIPTIDVIRENGKMSYIKVPNKQFMAEHAVGKFTDLYVQKLGELLFKKTILKAEETKPIELAFIQASLNEFSGRNLLVTENKVLLTNRKWFEGRFSSPLNIVSMEEAAEFIDLLFKFNSKFAISSHSYTSKHLWYWLSFRCKIPNYNVDTSKLSNIKLEDLFQNTILDAFSQRVCFLLMCIDEIGFQRYSVVNNDTMEDMVYHFNYFITLITGVFDSLAIQTFNKYGLTFEGSNNPSRISLNSNTGKEFLKALKLNNPALRQHIQDNADLIKAPYLLRDLVIHRESLHGHNFNVNGWKANLLYVHKDFVECLKRLGDKYETYNEITKFGIYSGSFLCPYQFAKTLACSLFNFCNIYLQLLGYTNFIEDTKNPNDSFFKTFDIFKEDNLGF